MGLLREKMVLNMELKGFSASSIKSYAQSVAQFVEHFGGKPPGRLGEAEVKEYLHYLIKVKKVSLSTVRISVLYCCGQGETRNFSGPSRASYWSCIPGGRR